MRFNTKYILPFLISAISLTSCRITKHTGLTYMPAISKEGSDFKLDVFSPKKVNSTENVFVFLHGGGWSHGKKTLYKFLGKRMARKGVVGVIVDYPLSPETDWNGMAAASAKSIKWVKENISKYGGDPNRVFISGHSAGGHLAALISVKNEYLDTLGFKNPFKGVILIDAAGLDMYNYLKTQDALGDKHYQGAFSNDPETWKKASPIYFLHKGVPPMLIYTGQKTYPNIKESNLRFVAELAKYAPNMGYKEVKRKHHIPMIFQFYNSHNKLYKEIIHFMNDQK